MISVFQNQAVDDSVIEEIANRIYSVIFQRVLQNSIGKDISKKLEKINSSFKQLIKTPLNQLLILEKKFGKVKVEEKDFLISLYEKIRLNLGGYIVNKLQLKTCPYCNMDTIICYDFGDMPVTQANFDHYYSKSQHPLLSICIYNLNIVCNACNIIKSNKKIKYSSYNKDYFTDDLLSFTYKLVNQDQIEVVIEQHEPAIIGKNIGTLRLNNRYNSNTVKHYVKWLAEKIEQAPDTHSAEDIKDYLKYVEEENYATANFSKLTHDIINELLTIKYGR